MKYQTFIMTIKLAFCLAFTIFAIFATAVADSVERKVEYAKGFPAWLDLRAAYARLPPGELNFPFTCKSAQSCEAVVASSRTQKIPPPTDGLDWADLVHVRVEVNVNQPTHQPDIYDGFFIKFPAGEYHVVEESFGSTGCGDADFVKVQVVYAKENLVIFETLWDGFTCASMTPSYNLNKVVIAKQSKLVSKVALSRFDYYTNVIGFFSWKDEDSGPLGYKETAKLEVLPDLPCDPKKFLSCTKIDVARKIEWPLEKNTVVRRAHAATLYLTQAGEWLVFPAIPWSPPPDEFAHRNNLSRPELIVSGPANLREEPNGKVIGSIPDKEKVTFEGCHSDLWVRVKWKGREGVTSVRNLPDLNMRVLCYGISAKD